MAVSHLRPQRQRKALGLLILNPDYIKHVSEKLDPDNMVTDFNKALYKNCLKDIKTDR